MLGDQYFVYEPKIDLLFRDYFHDYLLFFVSEEFNDHFKSSVERIQVIKIYSSICFY